MKCIKCKSKFLLTEHHTEDHHLNRRDPRKSKKIIILCETCHFQIDFQKTQKLYFKVIMRRYLKRMDKFEMNSKKYYKHQMDDYVGVTNKLLGE